VDSIVVEMATKSSQVVLNTTKATNEILYPSTMSTIIEIEEDTKNPQMEDGTRIVLMVE
jgi:hypothetical protein